MRPQGSDVLVRTGFLAAAIGCGGDRAPAPAPEPAAWESAPDEAVGAARCVACHAEEASAWAGSHHDHALELATPATVLGAFDGRTAHGMGQKATFVRDGEAFVVETTGLDGAAGRFEVAYTFGIDPIQQYLTRSPGGAVQTLPWLWDPRAEKWLALYDEPIPPGDLLHWAGPNQRWNHVCADCHGTGVRKGYDAVSGTYATTWTDEDVACEACHGNGSRHAAWADAGATGTDPGLPVRLGGEATWEMDAATGIARRVPVRTDHVEVDTCGRCHSRRLTISEAPPSGQDLLDTHRVAILDADLYAVDGQIHEEVYEWGSFVQSAMYAAGVTCTDCHDAHSGDLRGEGNAVCARCHLPARFDTAEHHHHDAIACVDCHMPPRTYMVVDERRDHSIRVPRPDLALSIGAPEPCTGCHADRGGAWAAEAVRGWYPAPRHPHWGEALYAGRTRAPDAPDRLVALAADPNAPGIARATAISLLARFPAGSVPAALGRAAKDADPLVRREAASAGWVLGLDDRVRLLGHLLDDPVLGVRLAAVDVFAGIDGEGLGQHDVALAKAVAEARAVHALHADRPEAWTALGDLDAALGDAASAETSYRRALALDPRAVPPRVNLADLLRATRRDAEATVLLVEGLGIAPDEPGFHHALGLAMVRAGDLPGAMDHLGKAATLDPSTTRYAYVYAVALSSSGRAAEAERVAAAAYERAPGDPDLLLLLQGMASGRGDSEAAAAWRERAVRDAPWAFGTAGPP